MEEKVEFGTKKTTPLLMVVEIVIGTRADAAASASTQKCLLRTLHYVVVIFKASAANKLTF